MSRSAVRLPAAPAVALLAALLCGAIGFTDLAAQDPVPADHPLALTPAQEARVDSLVGAMTLREKAGQMNQYTSFYDVTGPAPEEGTSAARFAQIAAGEVGSMLNVTGAAETRTLQEEAVRSRLGIPMLFAFDVIHGFETQFPLPLAEAATWSPELVREAARWAATEASAHGLHWTFAPMVDVSPDARWGRIVEGAGEDPYLGSVMAAARVRGFQGDDLSSDNTIAACAKHLAGYGYARGGRDYNAVDVSDYTLYNEILPPFRAAAEAGAATFMNSFNTLAGVPATGSEFLQRDWLKGTLGWPGFIVSDWNSIGEMIAHGVVTDRAAAAEIAVEAGSDMDMETGAYLGELVALVEAGAVDEALLDDAARRILRVKMALGLFDDPYRYCDTTREASAPADPDMRAAAIETAARSAVLLQNDTAAGRPVLPLDLSGERTIAVIGDLAADTDSPLGTWSLAAPRNSAVSLVAALRQALGADSARLTHVPGPPTLEPGSRTEFLYEIRPNTTDTAGMAAAVAAAQAADVVLLALGEPGFMSGEARSRTDLGLPGVQQQLYDAVVAARPDAAVVLYTGRPLDLNPLADAGTATLLAWQPGTYGNLGIAEVLLGERAPAGKLPVSFPRSVGQEPLTYRDYSTGRPEGPGSRAAEVVFYSHYMDALAGALYPFGHGLSYTGFALSEPVVTPGSDVSAEGEPSFAVSARVTNTGERAGLATAQLYVQDPSASRARPVKELRGFTTVELDPGASADAEFTVGREELQFWTPEAGWHVEPGTYRVWVGTSSAGLGEGAELTVPQ